MAILLLSDTSDKKLQSIIELAKKLGIKFSTIDADDKEDLLLGNLMKKEKTGKKIDRQTIFDELKK
jgi:hypothetical protein